LYFFLNNCFNHILKVFFLLKIVDDKEKNATGAKANGLLTQVMQFDFLFYIHVLSKLFDETGILNRALQDPKSNITSALEEAQLTIQAIVEMKIDPKAFDELMTTIEKFAEENYIDIPSTTNQRGRKRRRNEESTETIDPKERYRGYFEELIDVFVQELSQKFNTDNYKPLIAISNIIVSTEQPEISDVFFDLGVYRKEIEDMNVLETELTRWYRFKKLHSLKTIPDVHKQFAEKNLKLLYPNIFILLSIFLTVPFSSAEGERAFSCLKRIKTYLRSTMNQSRISSLSIINIHSVIASKLNINHLIDLFSSVKERRLKFH